jgi:hypothetical protein
MVKKVYLGSKNDYFLNDSEFLSLNITKDSSTKVNQKTNKRNFLTKKT